MARPTKLTPELQERLTEAIRAGNYYEAACGYAGIHYSTFRRWMDTGERAKSGKFREFYEAVTRAEQEAEVRMVAQWQKHMPEDYRAIRDFLERRYPERWARQNKMDMRQEVTGRLEVAGNKGEERIMEQIMREHPEIFDELFRRE